MISRSENILTGRVIEEHRERYYVQCENEILEAGIKGRIMHLSGSRPAFPAVGDMVLLERLEDGRGIIHECLPRTSVLMRRAAGRHSGEQVIAANIDFAFIVMSGDEDFSLNRLERYLTIVHEGDIRPVIILNKSDLLSPDKTESLLAEIRERHPGITLITASAVAAGGIDKLKKELIAEKLYCFIGSSGVGKSSLINRLTGSEQLEVNPLSTASAKGVHTTTFRQLIELKNGSMLIDTPGLREVGLTGTEAGLYETFSDITTLAENCRYRDCRHEKEPGCAVRAACEAGNLHPEKLENYLRLKRESDYYQMPDHEKRRQNKNFAKTIKEFKRLSKTKK
jgi:ribosome biogenesis GTPase / thiamine phosphate phosphatase